MEHCTGASKEIKFNIQAREELKKGVEKQQTSTAAWKMGCRGHYHNQGNCGVRRPNRY